MSLRFRQYKELYWRRGERLFRPPNCGERQASDHRERVAIHTFFLDVIGLVLPRFLSQYGLIYGLYGGEPDLGGTSHRQFHQAGQGASSSRACPLDAPWMHRGFAGGSLYPSQPDAFWQFAGPDRAGDRTANDFGYFPVMRVIAGLGAQGDG